MSQLPIESAIPRFKANEERVDMYVNGPGYTSSDGQFVPGLAQSASLNGTLNPTGDFVSGKAYKQKDVYGYENIAYIVLTDHVSTSVASDIASGKVTVYQNGVSGPNTVNQFPVTNQSKFSEIVSIRNYGGKGDGVTNEITAVRNAKLDSSSVHFPAVNGMPTIYSFSGMIESDFAGLTFSADSLVTLSFESNEYALYRNSRFDTDIRVFFRDVLTNYYFDKSPSLHKKNNLVLSPPSVRYNSALNATSSNSINARQIGWPADDTFVSADCSKTERDIVFNATPGTQSFKGAFFELGPYETVSAMFDDGFTPGPIGIIVRSSFGFFVLYKGSGPGNFIRAYKAYGQPISGNVADLPWTSLGQGLYDSFGGDKSVWSVSRISTDKVIIKLNGCAVTAPSVGEIGDIYEIGFACFTDAQFKISGFTYERRSDAQRGVQRIDRIRAFGDSRVASFPGSYIDLIKPILDCEFGLKIVNIDNYGVAGTSVSDSLARLKTYGTGGAYYVILNSGTNPIQGQQNLASFESELAEFADYCFANSAKPVFVIPGMFYTRAQSGGIGQASANYDKGAPYRMIMERLACEKGCVLVKTPEEMPNPDPSFLVTDPGFALLRDNIHEDNSGSEVMAKSVSQAMADDFLAMPGAIESSLAPFNFMSGVSSTDFSVKTNKAKECGFGGTLQVTDVTIGAELISLPRWARPTHGTNFIAQALNADASAMLGLCYVNFNQPTGKLVLILAPVGTKQIILDSCSYMS